MPTTLLTLERVLLALWIGATWGIGYLAAPVLFATLDDRQLAGTLAGRMFDWMNYLGLVTGSLLLLSNRWRCRVGIDRRAVTLMLMLVIILANQYLLAPWIAELRATGLPEGSEVAARFARLHGVASFLYLINSLLGAGLVAFGIHRPEYTK